MLFQGKDGELRIVTGAASPTLYYLEVLFTEMDFTAPISRPRTEETLVMDRGNFDTNAHYIEGNDEPRYSKIPLSFSCKLADTINTRVLHDFLEGKATITNAVGGSSAVVTTLGTTTIDGNTLPAFLPKVSSTTPVWNVEILWDGTNDYGLKYNEAYFVPGESTITESADGVMLSVNAQVLGDVTRITAFSSTTHSFI